MTLDDFRTTTTTALTTRDHTKRSHLFKPSAAQQADRTFLDTVTAAAENYARHAAETAAAAAETASQPTTTRRTPAPRKASQ